MILFFFNCKTAYDVRISDWSSYVCSSDLVGRRLAGARRLLELHQPGIAGRLGHRFHRDAAGLGELGEDVLVEGALEIAAVDADLKRAALRAQYARHGEDAGPDRKTTSLHSSH